MQGRTAGVSSRSIATEAGACLFLSPEWIDEVVASLRKSTRTDPYLKNILSAFTMRIVFVVQDLPDELREYYESDQAVIYARVEKGAIAKLKLAGELPGERYQMQVTCEYQLAQKIITGKASPVASFLKRRLLVEPVNFPQWPKYVPKARIAVNLLLKLARRIPATFAR